MSKPQLPGRRRSKPNTLANVAQTVSRAIQAAQSFRNQSHPKRGRGKGLKVLLGLTAMAALVGGGAAIYASSDPEEDPVNDLLRAKD